MNNYKADTTLNEKDSLEDMLNLEKNLVKCYATAITEGVSEGYRSVIKEHIHGATKDQLEVFLQMTDHGYCQVQSASEEQLKVQREKFDGVRTQLS